MKKVRITAIRKACYPDLMEKYENPIQHACDVKEGQTWVANGWCKPEGFCDSAWGSISPFIMTLAHGGGDFYDGWMKNPKSAMISCNDGFRPVSFYLEALEEDAEYEPFRDQLSLAGLSEEELRKMDPDDRVAALEKANLDPYDYIYLAC